MIQQFVTYIRDIKGYSEQTATAYEADIRHFARWAQRNINEARWSTIKRADLDKYISEMSQAGLAPATTNRRLSSISAFYNYLRREGRINYNPTQYESRRKQAQTIPNTIPIEDIRKAYENALGVTKLMIGILATTGIRIQELLDTEWQDIDFGESTIRVRGKGGKERKVYTTAKILAPLKAVAELRKQTGRLFYIDQRQARYMIYEALKAYSTARQLSPHAIRHTVATQLAKEGANAMTIAKILGHSKLETTQKYVNMAQVTTKEAMRRMSIL